MILQLSQVKTSIDDGAMPAADKALSVLKLRKEQVFSTKLTRVSIDARRKDNIHFVSSVAVEVADPLGQKLLRKNISGLTELKPIQLPDIKRGSNPLLNRPVIIGFGPAGMFAALLLAQNGYRPLVLERGASLSERVEAVNRFWQGGKLDTESNVQFGEGGAGTFSDGKLTTRINDPLCGYVLTELVRHGAPDDILIKAKPHVGTDLLRNIVVSIRKEIIRLGGEVRFLSKVDGFNAKGGKLTSVSVNGEDIAADAVIAAIGHSARDTFDAINRCGTRLIAKPFSVGARIEHLQTDIERSLYGEFAGHPNLPAGEYQLSYREGNRAAYTFCMCPGGMVVAAASGEQQTVTNGMSYRARDLKNSNSAFVVSVDCSDFGDSWRDAVDFQCRLERRAYEVGDMGDKAPFMRVGDLLRCTDGKGFSGVEPSYPRGVKEIDLTDIFPAHISEFMKNSLPILGRRLNGFDSSNAILTGVETRTSSPVRIPRGSDFVSLDIEGLYPCGEGAGYAGGITSAAVDGLRCAMAVMEKYKPHTML